MSSTNPYQYDPGAQGHGDNVAAAFADESARATFIRQTYTHLAGAILAFVGLEAVLFSVLDKQAMMAIVSRMGGMGWLLVLGAFMVVSWVARMWADSGKSRGIQYLGLSLYVVAEAIIFLPILYIATYRVGPQVPMVAGVLTGLVFVGLTAFVFMTRVDLNWMGKYLFLAGLIAMGAIVCSILIPGITLGGIVFPAIMVALASGYILYDTSNVLHHYRTDQHVAASLALFASVALLFWYILRIVMAFSSQD